MRRPGVVAAALAAVGLALGGCGYDVQLGDLFAVTRTGPGGPVTLVVNQSGQITCNHGRRRMLSSAQVITARDLSDSLSDDATAKLTLPRVPGTVYYYRVRLQQGTIAFPDRAATGRRSLGQLEAFVLQAAAQYCRSAG